MRVPDKGPHSEIERDRRVFHMHAFIIEDEYLIAQSLRDMLERLGFDQFSFARSEDAAVQGVGDRPIDLITADVRLLPGDGVEAVEAIGAKRKVPVIFITGYADELKDRAPDAIVIQKPIEPDQLATAVKAAVPNFARA